MPSVHGGSERVVALHCMHARTHATGKGASEEERRECESRRREGCVLYTCCCCCCCSHVRKTLRSASAGQQCPTLARGMVWHLSLSVSLSARPAYARFAWPFRGASHGRCSDLPSPDHHRQLSVCAHWQAFSKPTTGTVYVRRTCLNVFRGKTEDLTSTL